VFCWWRKAAGFEDGLLWLFSRLFRVRSAFGVEKVKLAIERRVIDQSIAGLSSDSTTPNLGFECW
jgi:hypothetical protein